MFKVNLNLGLYLVKVPMHANVLDINVKYFDKSHPEGNLTMVYYPLSEETQFPLKNAATLEGLVETDTVAWLDQFFPHGKERGDSLKKVEKEYMRKGVGQYLMEVMLSEAARNGAKMIWAKVDFDNPYMHNFIKKNGFRPLEKMPDAGIYYMILK